MTTVPSMRASESEVEALKVKLAETISQNDMLIAYNEELQWRLTHCSSSTEGGSTDKPTDEAAAAAPAKAAAAAERMRFELLLLLINYTAFDCYSFETRFG